MHAKANYLSSEPIYALNRVLAEIIDELGAVIRCQVVPVLYMKRSRTWHYACVTDAVWNGEHKNKYFFEDSKSLFLKIAKEDNLYKQFRKLKEHMLENREYTKSWEWMNDYIENLRKINQDGDHSIQEKEKLISKCLEIEDESDFLRKLLLFYFGIKNHRYLFLSGTLYQCLEASPKNKVFDRLDIDQSGQDIHKGAITSKYYFFGSSESEDGPKHQIELKLDSGTTTLDSWIEKRGIGISMIIVQPFYSKYVDDIIGNEKYITILPIHDIWLGNIGYGGIWGSLICTFKNTEERNKFTQVREEVVSPLDRLRSACEVLSAELFASALVSAASIPIKPPYDLIEHFVRVLIHVQDWDRVTVKRGDTWLYCYQRTLPCSGGSPDYLADYDWQKCDREECRNNKSCKINKGEANTNKTLIWGKNSLQLDIWSPEFIPELTNSEREHFRDYVLEFEYPATSTVPVDRGCDDRTHELFELAVVQQQIEVLRTLIPKVQARRAALRSAVSAIMGRNMSHNIGSHVLARYASVVREDLDKTDKDHADHRTDFLSYLQRRMDFLAEIATSDTAFWSQSLSLKDQLGRLNYEKQKQRFFKTGLEREKDQNAMLNRPVLLSYITGKETLSASVEYGKPTTCGAGDGWTTAEDKDVWFSCPGGEVGVHALYVILENIIRNSARHGSDSKSARVSIFVYVDQEESSEELIKLVVVDPRTELDEYGQIIGKGSDKGALQREIGEVAKGIHSDYHEENVEGKRQGERKHRLCLHNEINSILRGEPFLDPNGSPNAHYWGVREIQISAQYLRRFALSDLESADTPLSSDDKPVVKAGVHKLSGDKYCLKYEFYVSRAKNVAIVGKTEFDVRPELGGQGVKPFAEKEGGKRLDAQVRGYEFLIKEGEPALGQSGKFPVRQFVLTTDEIKDLLEKSTVEEILADLHARCADKYRKQVGSRAAYWGTAKIVSVVGWEPREPHLVEAIGRFSSSKDIDHVQSWMTDEGFIGLNQDGDDKLCATRDTSQENNPDETVVGVGWRDHPNDNDFVRVSKTNEVSFPERPYFGGIAVPCNEDMDNGIPYKQVCRWIAMEPCWSDSPQTAVLAEIRRIIEGGAPNDPRARSAVNELVSAAIPRVIVLDERVQSRRFDKVRAVTLYKYWPMVGLWSPLRPDDKAADSDESGFIDALGTPRCDLDHPNEEDIKAFLKAPTQLTHQGDADFLLVHLTILEKLKKPEESINQTLTSLVKGTRAENAIKVIVSGRGVPAEARPGYEAEMHGTTDGFGDARFVPISAVLEYLVIRPSKLGLMRVLWSA